MVSEEKIADSQISQINKYLSIAAAFNSSKVSLNSSLEESKNTKMKEARLKRKLVVFTEFQFSQILIFILEMSKSYVLTGLYLNIPGQTFFLNSFLYYMDSLICSIGAIVEVLLAFKLL